MGHSEVRPRCVQSRGTIHWGMLRLRTVPYPRHRRGAGAGAPPVSSCIREARSVGRWTQNAHEAMGESQVRQVYDKTARKTCLQ